MSSILQGIPSAMNIRTELEELSQGGSGTVEEGTTDYTAPTAKTMLPSSFGMTFCVDLDAKELRITARWGHYARERSETVKTPTGEQKLVFWKRSQREGISQPISLKPGGLRWTPDPERINLFETTAFRN